MRFQTLIKLCIPAFKELRVCVHKGAKGHLQKNR